MREPRLPIAPSVEAAEMIKVTIYMLVEEHKALKLEAVQRSMTLSQVVLEALHGRVVRKYVGPAKED